MHFNSLLLSSQEKTACENDEVLLVVVHILSLIFSFVLWVQNVLAGPGIKQENSKDKSCNYLII